MNKKIYFALVFLFIFLEGVLGANIALVVSNPSNLNSNDNAIKNFLITEGHNVVVKDDVSFNPNNYSVVIVSESVSSITGIFDNKKTKTLFMSRKAVKNSGIAGGYGLTTKRDITINERKFITEEYSLANLRVYLSSSTIHYINGLTLSSTIRNLAHNPGTLSQVIILTIDRNTQYTERNVYFGLINAVNWNSDAKNLFRRSILWLIQEEDFDGDGYTVSSDCNDNNVNIHPGATEIPYDNIDQNCDGSDLKDVDTDGFDALAAGGNDCNDNDNTINPDSDNPLKDCINEAPVINSHEPTSNSIRVIENKDKVFSIVVSDRDNDSLVVKWYINSQLEPLTGLSYNFKKSVGDYILEAGVYDGKAPETKKTWNVSVRPASEFTCSESGGSVCTSNQICTGSLLGVSDSNICCSVACSAKPPEFLKITKKCESKNNNIEITFENVEENKEIKIGEKFEPRLKIRNKLDKDYDFDLNLYVYDITKDKIIEKQNQDLDINKDAFGIRDFELLIEEELNVDDEYALFVYAESEKGECNQKYVKIDLKREDYKTIIDKLDVQGDYFVCGDSINAEIEVKNLGLKDDSVYIKIKNNELGINAETEKFDLKKYRDKDSVKKNLILNIGNKAVSGQHVLIAEVYYSTNKKSSFERTIILGECKSAEVETQPVSETITLDNERVSKVKILDISKIAIKPWVKNLLIGWVIFLIIGVVGCFIYSKRESLKSLTFWKGKDKLRKK